MTDEPAVAPNLKAGRFEDELARHARSLAARSASPDPTRYPRSTVEIELRLTLDQLDTVRARQHDADERLRDSELDVGTELADMDAQRWWYGPNREERWRDRQRLKSRRVELALERARLEATFEQRAGLLSDRVFSLVQRLTALGP